jgi:hypothetical protein
VHPIISEVQTLLVVVRARLFGLTASEHVRKVFLPDLAQRGGQLHSFLFEDFGLLFLAQTHCELFPLFD